MAGLRLEEIQEEFGKKKPAVPLHWKESAEMVQTSDEDASG